MDREEAIMHTMTEGKMGKFEASKVLYGRLLKSTEPISDKDIKAVDMAMRAMIIADRCQFEYDECKRIVDNPTPDVTQKDRREAYAAISVLSKILEW